jgi:hypothetical protein
MIRLPSIQSIKHRSTETDVRKKKPAGPVKARRGFKGDQHQKTKKPATVRFAGFAHIATTTPTHIRRYIGAANAYSVTHLRIDRNKLLTAL